MAIFSAHHDKIGRSTHAAGTAGAHARYITRDGAASEVMGEHMPTDREKARTWLDEQEATDRKNGRVCDKLLFALPIELDAAQRADLVRDFMQRFGDGRVAWLAGVHDRGEDAHNPHVHLLIRDKDHETGKRVFGTSEKGSTDRIRELWETAVNEALERAGHETRIDRRSLADQGLAREAGIHVGPNVHAMEAKGIRPESMAQDHTTSRGTERVVNWPEIDQGRTRADRQREIDAMNAERERGGSTERGRGEAETATLEPEPHQLDQDGPPEDRWGPSPEYEDQATWEPDHEADAAKVAAATPPPKQRPEPEPVAARDSASPDPRPAPANQNTGPRHNPHVHGNHRDILDAYEALRRTDPVTASRLFGQGQNTAPDKAAAREATQDALKTQWDLAWRLQQQSQANQREMKAWKIAKANEAAQAAYKAAQGQREELGGPALAREEPEAIQRPPHEAGDRPEATPSPEMPPRDPLADRLAWAAMLRGLDTADRAREATQQGYKAAQGQREDTRAQPTPEPAREPQKPAYDPAADLAAIAADRERIRVFAERLDAAFARHRERHMEREAAKERTAERPSAEQKAERPTKPEQPAEPFRSSKRPDAADEIIAGAAKLREQERRSGRGTPGTGRDNDYGREM